MVVDSARCLVYGDRPTAESLREVSDTQQLFRLSLLERVDTSTDAPFNKQSWTCSPRLLAWLLGESVEHDLAGLTRRARASLDRIVLSDATRMAAHTAVRCERALVIVHGASGSGRGSIICAVANDAGMKVTDIDATRLAKDHVQLTKQLKLIARECKLLQRAPLICNIDALVDDKDQTRVDLVGSELVSEIDGPVFVTCGVHRPAMRWDRPCVVIDVKPPTSQQRAKLWRDSLGSGTEEDAQFLATQFPLAPALIVRAAEATKTRANGRKLEPEDIFAGVRAVLDDKLGDYAKRVEVTQTWDDLVLPQDQMDAIKYLVARIRQRRTVYEQWGFAAKVGKGLGTSALFSGPPGTGKTMVAALIAKELGLELYQVDMAKVTSKWIGETERNLAALFDAAEAGHAVLLFDEADSIFGKRTDVKSSDDRYANLETNYLLQRLESFTGICLLTTNHENAIDQAFQRRLSLQLRFELPEAEEREQLWRAMLPAAAPVEAGLDMAALARRFSMSGGYIRNAALRAAFMAADEGSVITSRHLECAAKLEYEGMGKIAA
jgi:AAA+ superfamily predicted ATPase